MFTAAQFVAHIAGDYLIQSDWMAAEKRTRSLAAALHALSYALPFLLFSPTRGALLFIVITHFMIDRWGLARYLCWAKNFVGSPWTWPQFRALLGWHPNMPFPREVWSPYRRPWVECTKTGYPDSRHEAAPWMTTWLMIIADNLIHLCCNAIALGWIR